MNYLLKSDRQKKNKRFIFISSIVVFVLFSFLILGLFFNIFAKPLNFIATPFWKVKTFLVAKTNENYHFFKSKKSLLEDNKRLKDELKNFESKSLIYDHLLSENETLKGFLNRVSDPNNFVFAAILAKPPVSPYDTLIIDVGENYGLKKDDLVFSTQNLILGSVSEVYPKTAKVSLFSSYASKLNAVNLRNAFPVEVSGKGSGNFYAKVPSDSDFLVGDVIVIPDTEVLVLGTIFKIDHDSVSSFSDVYIKSPVNIFELRNVLVKISN